MIELKQILIKSNSVKIKHYNRYCCYTLLWCVFIMTELVLLVSPNEMRINKNEKLLRKLFENHKNDNVEVVSNFLKSNNIEYSIEVGKNEFGETLIAYKIEGVRLFGIKH